MPDPPEEQPGHSPGRSDEEYFQAIEDRFAQLRGRPLILSTKDVALVDQWWGLGVPLRIVLSCLEEVFQRRAGLQDTSMRPILSLSYCRHAVAERFQEWQEGQLGSAGTPPAVEPDGRAEAAALLRDTAGRLGGTSGPKPGPKPGPEVEPKRVAAESLLELARRLEGGDGAPNLAAAEEELAAIEDRLIAALVDGLTSGERDDLERDVEARLAPLRSRLTDHAYRASRESQIREVVREREGLPRLTLYLL